MHNMMHKYHVLLATFALLTAACGPKKSLLRDQDNLTVVSANQESSMALKDRCQPVAMLQAADDKAILVEVVQEKADVVQVFRIYGGHYDEEGIKDARLWRCNATAAKAPPRIELKTKTKDDKAAVFIADFDNMVSVKAENYKWLEESIPLAVEAAMDDLFYYQKTNRTQMQTAFKSSLAAKDNPSLVEAKAQEQKVDIVVTGHFFLNPEGKKLQLAAEVLFVSNKKKSEVLTQESALDGTMFDSIRLLTEKVTKRIYKEELQKR